MRYIFTILVLSILLLTFGQNLNDISVRINNEPLAPPQHIHSVSGNRHHAINVQI
jgi:hypothetical protein